MRETMGNGFCSRRQRRVFQVLLLLTVAMGFIYGAMLYDDFRNQLKKAEAVAAKYQQHQESLSAQLQVVYEHRSRLEKSLQKERLEHKKAKEDFLVYKLEAQETLNKGRQDSNNRYSALNTQHQMLKNQHEELRKQHGDLQTEHQKLGEDLTRALGNHKEQFFQLQQEKEQEISKMKESIYHLQEENRQLRRAHQDVHTQLQDVKHQHKSLQSQHEQAIMSLEDHKSALAVAQNQLEEFKQLKETLNKMPSLRHPARTAGEQHIIPQATPAVHEIVPVQETEILIEPTQNNVTPVKEELKIEVANVQRADEVETFPQEKQEADTHYRSEQNSQQPETAEPTAHQIEDVGDEHKKELEEEEMEQVGKAERLEDDQEESHWKEQEQSNHQEENHHVEEPERGDERVEETNMRAEHIDTEGDHWTKPPVKHRSAYEEQLEQQRLVAQRAAESQLLKEHQESLHKQRLQEQILRQQQIQERERALQRHNEFQEQLHKQRLRQQAHYEHMDHDIVQGEEEQVIQEGAYEKDNQHQDEGEELDEENNANEPQEPDENAEHDPQAKAAVEDVNPADDPNNQGEDEFEEAGQDGDENQSENNEQQKHSPQKPGNQEVEEHLVMAGNPDQQEDNLDEQYQEEGEEEVQEDVTEEKKRQEEQNAEGPYGENDENVDEKNDGVGQEQDAHHDDNGKDEHDENYEEDEDEGAAVGKTNRRAEM
ncbi:Golgi integral membrane protein 4 isoform X1 [Pleurodeles waltl]|uniref:Golgi integral membrane protein 4 isoform X1 n=1 Tax=Pleurodeles waltl TaxID=8319 RepID=UPI0037099FFB